MNYNPLNRTLINNIEIISKDMTDVIFRQYFDYFQTNEKYILSLFNEAFIGLNLCCISIRKIAIIQTAALLRQLTEQIASINILVKKPETRKRYVELFTFRNSVLNDTNTTQVNKIYEKYNIKVSKPDKFLDYSWFSDQQSEWTPEKLLEKADLSDLYKWRKNVLNKQTHNSYFGINLINNNGEFPIINNFVEILCRLCECACLRFHELTSYKFIGEDKKDVFSIFRDNYNIFENRLIVK